VSLSLWPKSGKTQAGAFEAVLFSPRGEYGRPEKRRGRAWIECAAANGKVAGGITLNGGSWTGQFVAVRAQP
jgi:hypothetical protein